MSQRKLVGTAVVTSFLVHTAGLVAFATLSHYASSSRAQFSGQRGAIEILVTAPTEPNWSPELAIAPSANPDPPVVIEPKEAWIAKRHYVHSPVGDVPLIELFADLNFEVSPVLRERARIEARPESSPIDQLPIPKARASRQPPRIERALAKIEPPSTLDVDQDTPPDLSQNAPPNYPAIAIQRRWEGTVMLRIWIDETGTVSKVEVARSSGYAVLDGAAAIAVRRWRGVPANRGGKPAATIELLPVQFKL